MADSVSNVHVLSDFVESLKSRQRPEIIAIDVAYNEVTVQVSSDSIVNFLTFLRDDPAYRFLQLVDLCGVDYPSRVKRFDVVYHLLSMHKNMRVRVRVQVAEEGLVPSVSSVFPVAEWNEREAFDMYGILFSNHPDLRRILTDYGFTGYPLRKDFPTTGYTQVRYDDTLKRVVHENVNLTQDFRQFDFLSPWEGANYVLDSADKK